MPRFFQWHCSCKVLWIQSTIVMNFEQTATWLSTSCRLLFTFNIGCRTTKIMNVTALWHLVLHEPSRAWPKATLLSVSMSRRLHKQHFYAIYCGNHIIMTHNHELTTWIKMLSQQVDDKAAAWQLYWIGHVFLLLEPETVLFFCAAQDMLSKSF